MKSNSVGYKLFAVLALLGASVIGSMLFGTVDISVEEGIRILLGHIPVLRQWFPLEEIKPSHITIVMALRLPRILLALFVGMGLSSAGCAYQGVFSNPMADPYLIGVSSGAAFGATIAMLFGGHGLILSISVVSLAAFMGAMLVMLFVLSVARIKGKLPTTSLILAGIAVNYLLSSLIALLMLFNKNQLQSVYFWTLGSFQNASWTEIGFVSVVTVVSSLVIYYFSMELNMMMLHADSAKAMGVNSERIKKILLLVSSFSVAIIVSVCGIIGFVGLIIPHAARIVVGPDHKRLIPVATIMGGIFTIFADTVARSVLETAEISVGIITAIFGVPFFLILLYKNKKTII